MPRSKESLTLLLAATAVAVAACGSGATGTPGTTSVTVRDLAPVPASVPAGTVLRVADQLGTLETPLAVSGENKNFPYTVSYSNFVGGPPMLQAFQAGAVDLGWTAGTPPIFAQAAHQNVVVVAAYATEHSTYALVNGPGQHITSWAALKGKSVAYQQGTVEESALLQGLQSAGLTLKDITSVNLSTTSLVPALEAGKVDTAILGQPLTGVYLAKVPHAVQVPVTNDITDRDSFLIASTAALANRGTEAAIGNYIGRLVKAVAWENAHLAATAQATFVQEYRLPLPAAEAIVKAEGPTAFYDLPGTFRAPQQNLANLYAQAGVIPARENVSAEFTPLYNATVNAAQKAARS
jgi:sulfonate transport system substrate-binding protein